MEFDFALAELLADMPGLAVKLDSEEGLSVNDPATSEVVLRCIQEALANTLRHAGPTSCHVRLYRQGAELELEITASTATSTG